MYRSKLFTLVSAIMLISLSLSACATPAATTAAPQPTQVPANTAAPQPTGATEATTAPEATSLPESQVQLPEVDAASVTGDIIVAGSSTVFPVTERMAELFQDEGFEGNITVDSIGTGGGFERFCKTGETDISNASRRIKDTEAASCAAIGRTPLEFRVGTDALAIVVSAENDFRENVTTEELAKIYSSEAQKWSDVNPAWPAEDILRFSPGTDSGTFDFFVEFVMAKAYKDVAGGEEQILGSSNLQTSEDDNVLVQGVEGSPYAIGYFGYAYYQENADKLKILSVNDVTPVFETAESGEYPLARPLFIYSDAAVMQEKPQVAAFINFYLTFVSDEIEDIGYFPASPAALDASKTAWQTAMGSTAIVTLPSVDAASVNGDIIVAGSSTVFPVTERIAELFQEEGFAGNITIDSIGTGGGFERFCKTGETDISNASRRIKDTEAASCAAIGRTPIEFLVGTDALAIVVSKENDFLENVTVEELAKIYSSEAQKWSDVNPAWPAEDILRFSPGTDSGTFDFFVEKVMAPSYTDIAGGEAQLLGASNLQTSEDDNVLVQGVEGSPYAIGYFGYAYYQENASKLKILQVNSVIPALNTAESGEYPLSRPLFIYSDATIMKDKPQVAAFINFYLTHVDDEIGDIGYFPASPAAISVSRQAWLDAQ